MKKKLVKLTFEKELTLEELTEICVSAFGAGLTAAPGSLMSEYFQVMHLQAYKLLPELLRAELRPFLEKIEGSSAIKLAMLQGADRMGRDIGNVARGELGMDKKDDPEIDW